MDTPKLLLVGLLVILLSLTCFAQPDQKKVDDLQRLNKQLVTQYQAFKFDDGLKTANESLKLATELFGENSIEVALSYEYLGEVYLVKQKSNLAATNFHTAWNIHKKNAFKNINRAGRVLTQLAPAMIADKKEAELKDILAAIIGAADSGDKASVNLLPFALKGLSKLYIHTREFNLADETYIRRYSQFLKLTDQNFNDFVDLYEEHACYKAVTSGLKDVKERNQKFKLALEKQTGDDLIFRGILYFPRNPEVIQGKAVRLPIPAYPRAARFTGAGGSVAVRVLIDEVGNVLTATALCGHPLLRPPAEDVAKKAKFSPTIISGKAVRVFGIVTYNFVP